VIGLRIGLAAALAELAAIGVGADELGGGSDPPFSATPGLIYQIDQSGNAGWAPNLPSMWNGHYAEWENGAAGSDASGLLSFKNSFSGAGTARVALTGEPGWFANACSLSTGTTAAGNYGLTLSSGASISFSSTSGMWSYDCTFSVPVLSDAVDTFYLTTGFSDNQNPTLTVNGCYLRYTHGTNGGKFEFVCSKNSVRTVVDSGVTLVAGNYYHFRVVVTNDSSVSFYLKTVYSGGAWSDDGTWSSPTIVTTNIPTSTSFVTSAMMSILKSLGTNPRLVKLGFQNVYLVPPSAGGLGDPSTCMRIDENGSPTWIAPLRHGHPFVFWAYGRGGWVPTVTADLGFIVGGTGTPGSFAGTAVANGQYGTTNLHSGAAADGYSAYTTSQSLTLDASVQPLIIEASFNIPTLSTGVEKHVFRMGLLNSLTAAPSSGCYVEIDSNAAAAAQFVCNNGGTATATSSALTIVAGTVYVARLVITSTSVDFYLKADGAAAWGTPITISTNVPAGVSSLAVAAVQRKLAGTTSRNVQYQYVLAFQRSTT
jgi:hypothetical protein